MMDWITFVSFVGGGTAVFLAAWIFYVMQQKTREHAEMWRAINSIRDDLSAYKLKVSEQFATTEHLKSVETRLVEALEGINERLDKLLDAFQHHLINDQKPR